MRTGTDAKSVANRVTIHSDFTRRLVFAMALALSCTAVRAGEAAPKPATQPTTQPSTQPSDALAKALRMPEFKKGYDRAKADREKGILGHILPIPETFLLGWMLPGNENSNLLDYYGAILADRYKVKFEWEMFNSAMPDVQRRAAGYNAVMEPEIEKRFGAGVLDKAWREACNTSNTKRKEYLDARQKKAENKPGTTQPTDAGAEPAK